MQISDGEYLARLRTVVAEVVPFQFRKTEITGETRLLEDLSIDSMGRVMLAFRLEQEFKVDLTTWKGDVASIHRVQDVVDMLRSLGGTP